MAKRDDTLINESLIVTMIVVAVGMFVGSLASSVDTAVMGKFLGEDDISASQLVLPIIGIVAVISTIFGNGTELLLSEAIAKGDKKRAAQIFTSGVITVFLITSLASGALFVFAPQLCKTLGMTGEYAALFDMAVAYARGYAIGLPFFGVAITINQTLQLDGDRTLGLIAVLISTVVNIAGDLFCVAILHRGIMAVALCTSLSNIVMLFIIMLHYRPGRSNVLVITPGLYRVGDAVSIIKRGLPNAILIASEMVKGIILNEVLLVISDATHIAALSIMSSTNILESSILSGFFGSVSVICGAVSGEGDTKGLRRVLGRSYVIGLWLSAGLVVFALLFAGIIPRIFVRDENVIAAAATAIRITALALPFRIMSGIICGMYLGMKYESLSTVIHILRDMVIPGIMYVVFGFAFGVIGVWASVLVSYFISGALLVLFALIKMRNKKGQFVDKILLLDEQKVEYDSFEATMRNMEEVEQISEELRQYCLSQKLSDKMAFVTSLAVEEMCNNALEHNSKDGRKHCMEIKFSRRDENEWFLRIRDDYRLFDPCQWLKAHRDDTDEDGVNRFGIRMVCDMAKEVIYTQLLQMNNLIIVVGDENS